MCTYAVNIIWKDLNSPIYFRFEHVITSTDIVIKIIFLIIYNSYKAKTLDTIELNHIYYFQNDSAKNDISFKNYTLFRWNIQPHKRKSVKSHWFISYWRQHILNFFHLMKEIALCDLILMYYKFIIGVWKMAKKYLEYSCQNTHSAKLV